MNTSHKNQVKRARQLRAHPTVAERALWRHLRLRQMDGHKFRRQHPVGGFIVDFACIEQRLAIEVDGGQHNWKKIDYDNQRTNRIEAQGYRVLRFWNNDVLRDIEGVLEVIRQSLAEPPS